MSRALAWSEKVGIGAFIAICAVFRTSLPARIELGEAVLAAAALLLVQGLVRDVARVAIERLERARGGGSDAPRITCVCAESTIGASVIVVGLLLVFATSPIVLRVPPVGWPLAIAAVTIFGFATRHLVIDWGTRSLRWEPNHDGVVVLRRRAR